MINLKSPLSTQIGYGICAFNIFKSLIKDFNQEICYFPIGQPETSQEYHSLIQQAINNQEKFETTALSLTIWHENDLFSRIGKGLNCGLSFFELNKSMKWYLKRCNNKPNKEVLTKVIESQIVMMAPFTPFLCEELWERLGKKGFVSAAEWPSFDKKKVNMYNLYI